MEFINEIKTGKRRINTKLFGLVLVIGTITIMSYMTLAIIGIQL